MDNDDKRPKQRVTSMHDDLKKRRERREQQAPSEPFQGQRLQQRPKVASANPSKKQPPKRHSDQPQGKVLTYQPRKPQRGAAESGRTRRERHFAETGERVPRPRHTRGANATNSVGAKFMDFLMSGKLVAIVLAILTMGAVYVLFVRPNSYRIYLGDTHVVTIAQGIIESHEFTENVSAIIAGQTGSQVYVLDTITFVPRNTRGEILTVNQALTSITEQVDYLIQGATFMVGGEAIATVASPVEAQSIIDEIALRTLPSTSDLVDVDFRNGHVVTAFVAKESVDSRETAMARLTTTSRETLEHEIQTGQFLSTLSAIYQIAIEEILSLNPGMGVNDVLRVGDSVTVAHDVPFLDLATIEEYQVFEDVDPPLEHRTNPALPAGTTQVVQEGVPGQLRRVYTVTRQLGVEQSRHLTNVEYVIAPVAYIIEMSGGAMPTTTNEED